jgi:beta-barrel assembly-enhancing protease
MSVSFGRRGFLRSSCKHCLGFAGLGLAGAVFGQTPADASLVPARLAKPALDTDEGGLWAMMDREETRLRRSSFVVRDAALNNYLRELVCKLGGEHCADVRIHVVRTAQFNATMAPNGMMQVWSGLLLRMENEAQLAAVLGHELGHYLERHLLERLRDAKAKSAAATFLAMFGLVGALAGLGVAASMFAFNREQEQRADRIGMRLMQRAGFDGAQAAQVWDNLLSELKITEGEQAGKRSPMFATHPPAANRRDELLALAGAGGGSLGDGEFERVVVSHRFDWLQEEIRRGQFEESMVLFDRMLRKKPDDAQVLFARGEVHRLRDQPGDLQTAIDDLARASAADQAPPESYRSLGLAHKRRADAPAAVAAFEKYLTLAPEAGDAGLIKTYMSELKP